MNLKLIYEKNIFEKFNPCFINFSRMDLIRKINGFSKTIFILCFVSLMTPAKADYLECIETCANNTPNGSFQQLTCFAACTIAWPFAKIIGIW
jgi:hypothetical protein